jgi:hypothetical protein
MSNFVVAKYSKTKRSVTRALTQYDRGQILVFEGFELPEEYEVHFANSTSQKATSVIGNVNGVQIPDRYLRTGENIIAWLYTHSGLYSGESAYTIYIPVLKREERDDTKPKEDIEWILDGGFATE